MKKLLFIILLLPLFTKATNYYFSASGNNSNSGTSTGSPWLSLSKMASALNAGTIHANDSIFFNRGDIFGGAITITTGAPDHIYIGAYGTGAKPTFVYSGAGSTPDSRLLMWLKGVQYYTFENILLTDTNHVNDKKTGALCGFAMYLGDSGSDSVYHIIVQNCDFSYVGMGVIWCGSFNKITHCTFTNFKNLNGGGSQSDYGATAVTIFGNDNEFSYNYVTGAWAQSLAFGYNGNVAEIFGNCSRNKILFNYCYDDGGISEFGGAGSDQANDNLYVGNIVIDCGAFAYFTGSQVQVNNFQVYNNVQVETVNSRFSGSNCGHGLPDSATISSGGVLNCDTRSFGYSSSSSSTVYVLQNNIFQLSSGMDVLQSGTGTKSPHDYNCYKLSNGSVLNGTANTHDITTSGTIFTTTTGNESTWNYHLATGSPCIGTGLNVSPWFLDVEGNPFTNNMGAYGIASPNKITFPVKINGTLYTNYH